MQSTEGTKTLELGDMDVEILINALTTHILNLSVKMEAADTLPTDKIRISAIIHEAKGLFHKIHFIS